MMLARTGRFLSTDGLHFTTARLKCVQIPSLSALGRVFRALTVLSRFTVAALQQCSSTGKKKRETIQQNSPLRTKPIMSMGSI